MATTKRIIQAPTLNNSGQITGGSSAPGGYLRKLPNELPGGDGPNSVRVIQTPQTNDSGNITGGNGVRTGTNTAEDPSTYNFTSITGVKQNTGNRVVVDGKEYILDGGARNATQNRTAAPSTTFKDNSAVLATAGKTGTTNNLAGGRTDSLPGVTKYAGNNKLYGNNRAGIDLVNSQNELDNLSEAEKAQRLAGAYNPVPLPTNLPKGFTAPDSVEAGPGLEVVGYRDSPDGTTTNYLSDGTFDTVKYNKDGSVQTSNGTPAPTVATTQNPVVKKTLPKEETPVKPDIQAMDLPTIQENIDRLTYKVNSGKSLTEDEYVTFNQLRRQATDMMKPQSLKGGLDDLKNIQQNEITTTQQTLEEQNAKDLEAFTKSQEAYKTSQIAMINQEENLSRQRMAAIFGATGQDSSTDTISTFGQMEQNYSLQKQAKIEEVQAKIDLFESQQRKDSAETIQKMKDRLYNTQLKAAEFDVANLQEINKFNQEQGKGVMKNLDDLKAMSDSIIASSTPLTEDQKAQAEVIGNLLIDENGKVNESLLTAYRKTNPNLMPYATSIAVQAKKKAEENKLAMQGLDADIKKAQLNKLLNPAKEYEYVKDVDGNTIAVAKDNPNERINITGGNADATVIDTIKKWEGFRDKAYQDSTGTWTIGYGFTNVNGQPVKPGMTMDRGTADNLLGQEISQRQNFMNYITVPLSDSQKAALSSFEFNLGSGIREKNAKPILDKINAGDLQGAGDLMKKYTTSKGQQLQGLVNRRNEEARLLLDKDNQTQQPIEGNFPLYANYIESGKLPTGIKDGTSKAEAFKKQALEGYITGKEQELNGLGLTIANPQAFASTASNAPKMKAINEALAVVPSFVNTMDQLISLTDKYGSELIPGNAKNQMSMLVKDAQLQAKEIYNLGVLNGPDLSLMESIINNPTDWTAKGQQLFGVSFKKSLENAKKKIMDNAIEKAKSIGLSPITTSNQTTTNADPLGLGI